MLVVCVVVAYDNPDWQLERCFASVADAVRAARRDGRPADQLRFLVVDNGSSPVSSTDGRVQVERHDNVGFGRAVNAALAHVPTDARVLLLNPDAHVDRDAIAALQAAEASVGSGRVIVGASLLHDGRPQRDAYLLWFFSTGRQLAHRRWNRQQRRQRQPGPDVEAVPRVCGAAVWGAASTLRDLGPFDPRFFLYGEDVDLSLRARAAGVALVRANRAVVHHDAGWSQSSAGSLVERSRADAAIRLASYHLPRALSLLQRAELAAVTVVGLLVPRGASSSGSRRARLARLAELARWGVRRDVVPIRPDAVVVAGAASAGSVVA